MYEKENSASPNRNEIMHMQSELLLLQKINEITERLKTIEQQSVLDTKQVPDVPHLTSATNPEAHFSNPLPTSVCQMTPREKGLLSELYKERKERQRLELITRQCLQRTNRNINTDYVGDIAENNFVTSQQNVHDNLMDDFQNPLLNRDIFMPNCSGDNITIQKDNPTRDVYCTDSELNQIPVNQNNRKALFQIKQSEHKLSSFCSQRLQEEFCSNIHTERLKDSWKNTNCMQDLNRNLSKDSTNYKNVEQKDDKNQHLLSSSSVLQQNERNQKLTHPENVVLASPANRHIMAPHQRFSEIEPCPSKIDNIDSYVKRSLLSDCGVSLVDNLHKKKQIAPQHEITNSVLTNSEAHKVNTLETSAHCDISHDVITSTTENPKETESTSILSRSEEFQTQTKIPPSDFCKNRLTDKSTCNSMVSELNIFDKDKNPSKKKESNTTVQNKLNKSQDIETSSITFKKPIGVPPRRKQTRMTKPLGVDVSQEIHMINDVFISDTMSCSDVQSEFDCQLLKGATKGFKRNSFTKPSLPVDSNYSINKFIKPSTCTSDNRTPKQQSIPCVKPVYSDVGPGKETRRYLTNNNVNPIYSIKPLPKPRWLSSRNTSLTDVHKNEKVEEIWLGKKQTSKSENTMEKKKLKKNCPGCVVPSENGDLDNQPLNSRTYNLIIETNGDTCQSHRYIREIERKYIQAMKEIKKNTTSGHVKRLKKRKPLLEIHRNNSNLLCNEKKSKPDESIYDIPSSDSEPQKGNVTPPQSASSAIKSVVSRNAEHVNEKRRQRIPYTEEEINNIITGVKTFGTRWNQILCTYEFHPTRKAVDLFDKYKRMVKQEKEDEVSLKSANSRHEPFSMCEDRRLVRGVKLYGYSWKTILHSFQFAKFRTSEDLRLRWRSMHQKPGVHKILNVK